MSEDLTRSERYLGSQLINFFYKYLLLKGIEVHEVIGHDNDIVTQGWLFTLFVCSHEGFKQWLLETEGMLPQWDYKAKKAVINITSEKNE